MSEIKLFDIKDGVRQLVSSEVLLERELQTLIEKNMETLFGVRFLKSEYSITNGRMDSIGIDENNCPVIFEYKRSSNENVINQGLFYPVSYTHLDVYKRQTKKEITIWHICIWESWSMKMEIGQQV